MTVQEAYELLLVFFGKDSYISIEWTTFHDGDRSRHGKPQIYSGCKISIQAHQSVVPDYNGFYRWEFSAFDVTGDTSAEAINEINRRYEYWKNNHGTSTNS